MALLSRPWLHHLAVAIEALDVKHGPILVREGDGEGFTASDRTGAPGALVGVFYGKSNIGFLLCHHSSQG